MRWCETVACERSNKGTSSQTQTSPACRLRTTTSRMRTRSARDLATVARRSALARSMAGEAIGEIGVDISTGFPKPLTDDAVRTADVVITMGCGDACPIYPGKRYEDWDLEDPAGKDLETVRRIRDEIGQRVRALVAELAPA